MSRGSILHPQTRPQHSKAVMVFIHGGAFLTGSGSINVYSPDYLINYDIVLITLNYRLHVFGRSAYPLPTSYLIKTE